MAAASSREQTALDSEALEIFEDNGESSGEEMPFLPNATPLEDRPGTGFRRRVILMCVVFIFSISVSQYLTEPPLLSIMEDIICREHYSDHQLRSHPRDLRCYEPGVQKTLAMVRGWAASAQMATPIIAQIPYGIIADKYGRRPVLFLASLGCVLQTAWVLMVLAFPDTFPIWVMVPGSIFYLIGGGEQMIASMVWTIVADVVPTAERTTLYYRLMALIMVLNVVTNILSAWLMRIDPWIDMWLGFAIIVGGLLSTLLFPETIHLRRMADDRHHHEQPADGHGMARSGVLRQVWLAVRNDIGHVWRFIFASRSIMLLIVAYAAYFPIRIASTTVQLQYMTKRFNWDWSVATFISTLGILATVVSLLVLLPILSHVLTKRYRFGPLERDLSLTRASIVLAAVGSLIMTVAASPWLFVPALIILSLGHGFTAQCRALLNAVVEPHTIATLNTFIGLVELIVGLVGAPALAWLLSRGIELGNVWYGLPYLAVTVLALCVTVAVFRFRIPAGVAQYHGG